MSLKQENTEEQLRAKFVQKAGKNGQVPARIVSAGYDMPNTNDPTELLNKEKEKSKKLNINASSFVPKDKKKDETQPLTPSNLPTSNETLTATTNTNLSLNMPIMTNSNQPMPNNNVSGGGYTINNFVGNKYQNTDPNQFGKPQTNTTKFPSNPNQPQNSMVSNTYLHNKPIMVGMNMPNMTNMTMYYNALNPQFQNFNNNNMMNMPYNNPYNTQNPNISMNTNIINPKPINTGTGLKPISDAKPFIPKSMQNTTAISPSDNTAQTKEEVKPAEDEKKTVSPSPVEQTVSSRKVEFKEDTTTTTPTQRESPNYNKKNLTKPVFGLNINEVIDERDDPSVSDTKVLVEVQGEKKESVSEKPEESTTTEIKAVEEKKINSLKSLLEAPKLQKENPKKLSSVTPKSDPKKNGVNNYSNNKKNDNKNLIEEKRKQLEAIRQKELKASIEKSDNKRRVSDKSEQKVEEVKEVKDEEENEPEDENVDDVEVKETKAEEKVTPKVEEVKEEEVKYHIENNYFKVKDAKKSDGKVVKRIFTLEYLLFFQNWKICKEKLLLDESINKHLASMCVVEKEEFRKQGYNRGKNAYNDRNDRNYNNSTKDLFRTENNTFQRGTQKTEGRASIAYFGDDKKEEGNVLFKGIILDDLNSLTNNSLLEKWGRKDISEAENLAKKMREEQRAEREKDIVRDQIKDLLNKLTLDTYDDVRKNIFNLVKDNVESQEKLLEVLFQKAVIEKTYVVLYSKLCKDLDKELPQKQEKNTQMSVKTSILRSKLLEKCKRIFKEELENIDSYIGKGIDQEEREMKMKQFVLGNVNFIGELINQKILSKKVVFQCLEHLLTKGKNAGGVVYQQNLEGIVILLDKFGTTLNKPDSKIKKEEFIELNDKVNVFIGKLTAETDFDTTIPGHIKYKIINLVEKKNRGWTETLVDKLSTIKSVKEVKDDYENEQNATEKRGNRGDRVKKLDEDSLKSRIKTDLNDWKSHITKGFHKHKYNWKCIEDLFKTYGHSIADIISAYAQVVIDFVAKPDDITICNEYMFEIINYYNKSFTPTDKEEASNVVIENFKYLSDIKLDNKFIIDIWAGLSKILTNFKLFQWIDLNQITENEGEEQIIAIFEVVEKAITEKEKMYDQLTKIHFIKTNLTLFDTVFNQSSD